MATLKNLNDLFLHTLQDIYYAEKHILKALPEMTEKASNADLKDALQTHQRETETQVSRLEQVFTLLGEKASAEKCPAIEGIVKETKELMKDTADDATRDAAIIAAAQAVEHYEITRYGTLATWADQLGHSNVVDLLRETLSEEEKTDEKLTHLAENTVNAQAA